MRSLAKVTPTAVEQATTLFEWPNRTQETHGHHDWDRNIIFFSNNLLVRRIRERTFPAICSSSAGSRKYAKPPEVIGGPRAAISLYLRFWPGSKS